MNFSGCSLVDSDFDACDLTCSSFEGAVCSGSRFVDAVIDRVKWTGANLSRTMWRTRDNVRWAEAMTTKSSVKGSSSSSSSSSIGGGTSINDEELPAKHPLLVSGVDISECKLDGCDFSRCSITEFNFCGVSLQRCSFVASALTLALLSRCSVVGCDFTGARYTEPVRNGQCVFVLDAFGRFTLNLVDHAVFKSCRNFSHELLSACNSDCTGLNVARLSLAGGDFRSFNFTDAVLTECDLQGCKLDYAHCTLTHSSCSPGCPPLRRLLCDQSLHSTTPSPSSLHSQQCCNGALQAAGRQRAANRVQGLEPQRLGTG